MKLQFQKAPWDLYFNMGYVLAMIGALAWLDEGNLLAIPLILFEPGYFFVAAVFPSEEELNWIERLALSLVLSVAFVALLTWALDFTPWGIRLRSISVAISSFILCSGAVAYWRRMTLPIEKRPHITLNLAFPAWQRYDPVDKALVLALVTGIAFAVATISYVGLNPRPGERFTEFFILGPGGNASDYPTDLLPSQPAAVIIGIVNHEMAIVDYSVRADLVALQVSFNSSCGCNETTQINSTTIGWLNLTIPNEGNRTEFFNFSIRTAGLWQLHFQLFRNGDFSVEYRELHIVVRVG